jgi:hypothetical protein
MAVKSIKLTDLRSATEASIKAVLGRKFPGRPGVLVGLWIDKASIKKLDLNPAGVARQMAGRVSVASGIKVKPGIKVAGGGVLVGYIQPKILKR